jgi:molybdopterin-containing oxidoreductase family membrane subunit
MLLATSLYRDYLVSSWRDYAPSIWEWGVFIGMLGVFLTPFLLFVRFLPVISAFEVKNAMFEKKKEKQGTKNA